MNSAFLKSIFANGNAVSEIRTLLKLKDPNDDMGKYINAISPHHLMLAMTSVFMETMQPTMHHLSSELFPNHQVLKSLTQTIAADMKIMGTGCIQSVMSTSTEDIMGIMDTGIISESSASEEDEWVQPEDPAGDMLLTTEELAEKRVRKELVTKKMLDRITCFTAYASAFSECFTSDPDVYKLFQDASPHLFTDRSLIPKIAFHPNRFDAAIEIFSDKYCSDGDQKTVAACYNHLRIMDLIEAQLDCDFKPFEPRMMNSLNNTVLFSVAIKNMSYEKFDVFLTWARKAYADFRSGETTDLNALGSGLMTELKKTATDDKSAGALGDWIMELLCHNMSHFMDAFTALRSLIPEDMLDLAREKGFDLGQENLKTMIKTKMSEITSIRDERRANPDSKASLMQLIKPTLSPLGGETK